MDKAKTIAFNHAGVNAKNVYVKKAKLDYDDGRVKYEIEFYAGVREYEYEIDATSGAILEYDIEYRD